MLMKWRDKRDVFMVATNDAGQDDIRQVWRHNVEVELAVPTCIKRYNEMMGGVDRLDQLRAYYSVGRAGRRWWKYIFWGLLNIGIINAYILWKMSNTQVPANTRSISLKTWKLQLIHDLVDGHESLRVTRRVPAVDNLVVAHVLTDNLLAGHSLVRYHGQGRTCRQCARQGKKTAKGRFVETRFGCKRCHVYLCGSGPCFLAYHQN